MLFLECRSKDVGNSWSLFTYKISGQKTGPEQKQRNVPVWAILGQYSLRDERRPFAVDKRGYPPVAVSVSDLSWVLTAISMKFHRTTVHD